MNNRVDILMATYNTDTEYLKKQIDSILKQTYKNFFLIISDDNSSKEEVKEILKKYEEQDNRIKVYLQEKNLGYIKNFEFLLNKSDSDYIMFADHDDIWYENKVENSLKLLKEKDVDLVYCNSTQIDNNNNVIKNNYFKYKNVPLINGKGKLAISRCVGIGCSQIFTKSVKEKMLPFADEVMAHDWLAAFIANENKGLSYIEEPLFGYRLHETNVFGGRNLSQNLQRWKEKNGKNYESYLKYRNESVIHKAYLDGIVMCEKYAESEKDREFINKLKKYYESLLHSKFINFHWIKYFRYLGGKNLAKKMIKEFVIFHLPVVGYLRFLKYA